MNKSWRINECCTFIKVGAWGKVGQWMTVGKWMKDGEWMNVDR